MPPTQHHPPTTHLQSSLTKHIKFSPNTLCLHTEYSIKEQISTLHCASNLTFSLALPFHVHNCHFCLGRTFQGVEEYYWGWLWTLYVYLEGQGYRCFSSFCPQGEHKGNVCQTNKPTSKQLKMLLSASLNVPSSNRTNNLETKQNTRGSGNSLKGILCGAGVYLL